MKSIASVTVAMLMSPAVAFACGWFLKRPPTEGRRNFPDKPLSQWEHVSSFDSAAACENYKVASWKEYKAIHEKAWKERNEALEEIRRKWGDIYGVVLKEGYEGVLERKTKGEEIHDAALDIAVRFESAKGTADSTFALKNATFASRCVPADYIMKK